jgi:TonB family protein
LTHGSAIYPVILVLLWLPSVAFSQPSRTSTPSTSQSSRISPSPSQQVWITLRTGEILTGTLVKIDHQWVDYNVRNYRQSVPIKDVESVSFNGNNLTPPNNGKKVIVAATADAFSAGSVTASVTSCSPTRSGGIFTPPAIHQKNPAKFTEQAINLGIQGQVVLEVVYPAMGKIRQVKVIQGLQAGLNESAIAAAKNIQFSPAKRNNEDVDCRGQLVYEFNFSPRTEAHKFSPKDGAEFRGQSRQLELKWPPVPGAVKYRLQVEYFVPGNEDAISQRDTETEELEYTMTFANYLRGRWRVSAILADGRVLPPSSWMKFRFER